MKTPLLALLCLLPVLTLRAQPVDLRLPYHSLDLQGGLPPFVFGITPDELRQQGIRLQPDEWNEEWHLRILTVERTADDPFFPESQIRLYFYQELLYGLHVSSRSAKGRKAAGDWLIRQEDRTHQRPPTLVRWSKAPHGFTIVSTVLAPMAEDYQRLLVRLPIE